MLRLYTRSQVYRACRKELKKHRVSGVELARNILFRLMDTRLIPNTYLDYLSDLYAAEYIEEYTFDEAFDAIHLYYGDLITQFIEDHPETY